MNKKKTLEQKALDYAVKRSLVQERPFNGWDIKDAWLAGYRAGRRDAKKGKRK